MPLLSAEEDFAARSLGSFASTTEKLFYIASLKRADGTYDHWGLEYTFGPEASIAAITRAHESIFLEILETPIPQLAAKGGPPNNTVLDLTPNDLGGGSAEHLDYVMEALKHLRLQQVQPSHQAA